MNTTPSERSANAAEFSGARDDVFSRIAGRYDVLCDLFSLGIHRWWKRRMARAIAEHPWTNLLDIAAGTGDVILRVADTQPLREDQRLIASDLCPRMLAVARRRADAKRALDGHLRFQVLDAHDLADIAEASIDLCTMSLGLKICDRERAWRQVLRVLRPGGCFIALEASRMPWAWAQSLYLTYMRLVMPVLGFIATGGDGSAYAYLLRGVREFPGAPELADEMRAHGFVDVRYARLSLGIVAIHWGRKPE